MDYSSALGALSPDAQLVLVVVAGMIALLVLLAAVVVILMLMSSKDATQNFCNAVQAFVPFFRRESTPKKKLPI